MKKIFWVASYPKSGNTWMRAILCSLFFTKEGKFDFKLLNHISNFDHTSKFAFLKNMNPDDFNKLNEISVICKYWIEAQKRAKIEENFAFFKTHSANVTLNSHQYTNEQNTAGLIYLVRDPRDVVISYAKHYRINIDKAIHNLKSVNLITWTGDPKKNSCSVLTSSWDKNYLTWKNLNVPKLFIKYEDLLQHTQQTLNKIMDFFLENYNIKFNHKEKLIKNIIETTSFESFRKFEKKQGFNEAPYFYFKSGIAEYFFRVGKSQQWKNELTNEQLKDIENSFSEILQELEYI